MEVLSQEHYVLQQKTVTNIHLSLTIAFFNHLNLSYSRRGNVLVALQVVAMETCACWANGQGNLQGEFPSLAQFPLSFASVSTSITVYFLFKETPVESTFLPILKPLMKLELRHRDT
jgi:hypothetical protein